MGLQDQLENSTLLTQAFVKENGGQNDHYIGLAILHIFLAFWICVANSSQIINVILSPGLRSQPKNVLICNVCVTELIMGVFLNPLYTDTLMQGTWRHDVTTSAVYELVFYCQVCISTLAVLVVAVERLYFLLTPNMMDGSGRRSITAVLVLLPWLIGVSLVVPIFKFGTVAVQSQDAKLYQLLWKRKFQSVVSFVSFVCPAFLLLGVVVALHTVHIMLKIHAKRRDLGPHPEKQAIKEALQVVSLSSIVCLLLQFPFFVALLIAVFCPPGEFNSNGSGTPNPSCGAETITWSVAAAILMLKPGVTPVVWIVYSDLREGFTHGLGFVPCLSRDAGGSRCHASDRDRALGIGVGQSQQAILGTSSM